MKIVSCFTIGLLEYKFFFLNSQLNKLQFIKLHSGIPYRVFKILKINAGKIHLENLD